MNTPLWSDGAVKQRWIDLSNATGKVGFKESSPWDFPAGTVFVKHFELELTNGMPASRRRIETRVLVKTADDDVFGLTYRWGDSFTNAQLVPPSGTNETFMIMDNGVARAKCGITRVGTNAAPATIAKPASFSAFAPTN